MVPRGVVHRPGNLSGRPVRYVSINSPAMDGFFTELGQLAERNGGRLSAGDLQRLGGRHHTIFTSPPASTASMRDEQP